MNVMQHQDTRADAPPDSMPVVADMSAYRFKIDDYNFTGYQHAQLKLLCDHDVLIRTRFPKLVTILHDHPQYAKWLRRQKKHTDSQIIDSTVRAIQAYAFNFQGNLTHPYIDLHDADFWRVLVDHALLRITGTSGSSTKRSSKKSTERKRLRRSSALDAEDVREHRNLSGKDDATECIDGGGNEVDEEADEKEVNDDGCNIKGDRNDNNGENKGNAEDGRGINGGGGGGGGGDGDGGDGGGDDGEGTTIKQALARSNSKHLGDNNCETLNRLQKNIFKAHEDMVLQKVNHTMKSYRYLQSGDRNAGGSGGGVGKTCKRRQRSVWIT